MQSHESLNAQQTSQHREGRQRTRSDNTRKASTSETLQLLKEKTTGCSHETLLHFGFRERVTVSIHQDCGSDMIVPYLDCDTVGSEWTNQEKMRTTGETVYDCKDKTDDALLHGTPRQISNRLFT